MKKILMFIGVVLSCATVHAWNPPDYALTFGVDTKTVAISSTAASPTQIFTFDRNAQRSFIINQSTNTIFISTFSTVNFSTSFSIPGVTAGNAPVVFPLDGVNSPFVQSLWAATNSTNTTSTISIYRVK